MLSSVGSVFAAGVNVITGGALSGGAGVGGFDYAQLDYEQKARANHMTHMINSDGDFRTSELTRTASVIAEHQSQGLAITAQLKYQQQLLQAESHGNIYGQAASTYNVRKASAVPTLNGSLGSEWNNATKIAIGQQSFTGNNAGWAVNYNANMAHGTLYLMWSDAGLHMAAEVMDTTPRYQLTAGAGLNAQDLVQLVLDPTNAKTAGIGDAYIFDFAAATDNGSGPAAWWEHWQHGADGYATGGVQIAGTTSANGYVLETLIPWSALQTKGESFAAAAGTMMGFGIMLVDFDSEGGLVDLITDFGAGANTIGSADSFNTIKLEGAQPSFTATTVNTEPIVYAAASTNYNVKMAAAAPTINGTLGSEWNGATQIALGLDSFAELGWAVNNTSDMATGTMYLMWSDAGLYVAASVNDTTPQYNLSAGAGLNAQDLVQLVLDPTNAKTAGIGDAYIFDLAAATDNGSGPAGWWEHWQHGADGYATGGVQIAGTTSAGGYVLEALIPWSALQKKGESFSAAVNTTMGFGILLVDFDGSGGLVDLITDFGAGTNAIGSADFYNTITLVY